MTNPIFRVRITQDHDAKNLNFDRVIPGYNAIATIAFLISDKDFRYFEGPLNNKDLRGYMYKNQGESEYDEIRLIYVERDPDGNEDTNDKFYMQTAVGQNEVDRHELQINRAAANQFIRLMKENGKQDNDPEGFVPSPSPSVQSSPQSSQLPYDDDNMGAAGGATSGATGYTPGNSQEPHRKSRKGRKERKGRKSRKGRKERKSRKGRKERKERKGRKL